MSKAPLVTEPVQRDFYDKYAAAEYMRQKGFHDFTHWTILYAARSGKLHKGEPRGRKHYWTKQWLDEWAELL